jgi:hypothetical protein
VSFSRAAVSGVKWPKVARAELNAAALTAVFNTSLRDSNRLVFIADS